jgi:hypothetical protein
MARVAEPAQAARRVEELAHAVVVEAVAELEQLAAGGGAGERGEEAGGGRVAAGGRCCGVGRECGHRLAELWARGRGKAAGP